jgi:hypothetical protein
MIHFIAYFICSFKVYLLYGNHLTWWLHFMINRNRSGDTVLSGWPEQLTGPCCTYSAKYIASTLTISTYLPSVYVSSGNAYELQPINCAYDWLHLRPRTQFKTLVSFSALHTHCSQDRNTLKLQWRFFLTCLMLHPLTSSTYRCQTPSA